MMLKSRFMMLGATAICAGITCNAAAQTNLTLYGIVDAGLTYVSNQNGASATKFRSGNLNGSRFGFRGTEELGRDTQAIFTLESGFDIVNLNTGGLFSRQSFLGLNNKHLGSLTVGRQYTPYYLFVGPLGPTAILSGATGAHPGDYDGLDTTIRISNSVSYTSPLWSGAQIGVQYGLGQQPSGNTHGSTLSAAFKYGYRNLDFALGYLKIRNGDTPGVWDPSSSASFGVSPINNGYISAKFIDHIAAAARYKIGKLALGVNGSNVEYQPGPGSLFRDKATINTGGLTASYEISPTWFAGAGYSYTWENKANNISNAAKYHQIAFEQTYSFSKRTVLYFLEAYQNADGQTLGKAGIRNPVRAVAAVGDSQNGTPSSSGDQTVLMIGMRHNF